MGRFREALEMGGLFDLGWKGDKYTWSNKHGDETFTKERLDRAVANIRWKRMFKEGWVEVLAARCSDHRPILLYVNQTFSSERKRKRLFRYEAKWSLEEDCEEVIKRVWQVRTMGRDIEKDLQLLLEDSRVKEPRVASDFRPISLCNVAYKIMSKVLANRLKKFLNALISPNQSAFIPGKLITDNIMVAYEVLHSMKARKKGKVGNMAIKLDMSKAYDRIEWCYLEAVMGKLGFCRKWIELIMKCVTTVSYSVLINGSPGSRFLPLRGLRQGDPLSPYLFILCAEGLSALLNHSDSRGHTRGVTVARGGTRINHLLFADDCILFGRAVAGEWIKIQELLLKYEKASGQFLNKEKTAIFFSSNSRNEEKRKILEQGGSVMKGSYEKYLGLPPVVGKSKYNTFRGIKERVWKKISNWKNSFLSSAGKEILIKAVLQNPRSMAAKIFKEKYFSSVSLFEAKLGYRPSFIWRSVWGALKLLKDGLRWRVGDGSSIRIWGQKWLQTPSSYCVQSPCSILNEEAKVSELISEGKWNKQLIERIFTQEEVEQICSIPISRLNSEDKMIWGGTKKGQFSVSSAYQMEMNKKEALKGESSRGREGDARWQEVWGLNIPGKVKIFMWRAMKELLATRVNLSLRKITDSSSCPICKNDDESVMHAIWYCPAAADVWSESDIVIQKWSLYETDLLKLWDSLVEKVSKDVLEETVMVMRNIWLRRNEFIFEGVFKRPSQVIKATRNELRVFQLAQQNAKQNPIPRVDRGAVSWSRPRESFVKANWDAAMSRKDRKVGLGVVIRDEEGEILGDAQAIVNAVNKGDEDYSSYGGVIEDAKKMLKTIENWSVNFVYREANTAAHVLAQEALSLHIDLVWIEETPNCIRSIICKEKSCNDVIVQ
ncbi:hypothetical protein F2P56_002016 [Juglans regia]|uniref:Reverse transcriptase domain-containing protein n=1 Tax=Juglans regia TaxID=51240 RepID=A0A834D4L9_JUGRE|nr:hypothetical protein F2P56_002016 [Juglans regia]